MLVNDEIASIEAVSCQSLRYDLEVEDNHNFLADGILVHNCQNLKVEITEWEAAHLTFEISEKLDGSSMTVYSFDGVDGVCSRNLDLRETEMNTFWRVCKRENLHAKIAGMDIALQGELIGEGIQGNPYKITGQDFMVFDIYDIKAGQYFRPDQRRQFCVDNNIKHVPVIDSDGELGSVDELLTQAEGKSQLHDVEREGLVFKCNQDPQMTFKAISNKFLLREK